MRYQHEKFHLFYSEQIKIIGKIQALLLVKILKIFDLLFTDKDRQVGNW